MSARYDPVFEASDFSLLAEGAPVVDEWWCGADAWGQACEWGLRCKSRGGHGGQGAKRGHRSASVQEAAPGPNTPPEHDKKTMDKNIQPLKKIIKKTTPRKIDSFGSLGYFWHCFNKFVTI